MGYRASGSVQVDSICLAKSRILYPFSFAVLLPFCRPVHFVPVGPDHPLSSADPYRRGDVIPTKSPRDDASIVREVPLSVFSMVV